MRGRRLRKVVTLLENESRRGLIYSATSACQSQFRYETNSDSLQLALREITRDWEPIVKDILNNQNKYGLHFHWMVETWVKIIRVIQGINVDKVAALRDLNKNTDDLFEDKLKEILIILQDDSS